MSKETIKIGFTGDIAFDEYTEDYYNAPEKIDSKLLEFLNNNDYNVVDLESPVTTSEETEKESLFHKMDPKHAEYVKELIKNPVAVIANNHMMDFGYKGLEDTLKNLKKLKMPFIGAGKNVEEASNYIILGDKVKVGIIAIQYKDYFIATSTEPGPFHDSYKKQLKKRVLELKKQVDWVVLVYHGGEEFLSIPMPYTRKLLKKFLNFGVDVIVAHHTHVVQGYESFGKKMIFYSLGNFIFDTDFQRAQKDTDKGVLLSIDFEKKSFEYDYRLLAINRNKNKIDLYSGKSMFKRISKTKYSKQWKKQMLRIREIERNKKKLRHNRIAAYLGDAKVTKMVPFSYFEKMKKGKNADITIQTNGTNAKTMLAQRIIPRRLRKNKYTRLLKECFTNKKYRYYAVARVLKVFTK